jgi:transglutaminase-like putative cysteine protease
MGEKSMLLSIRHTTTYTYNHPVLLEPHCLRLTPRGDSYASLIERSLNITPNPISMSASVENDGSISHWIRFEGETKIFTVESKALISVITDKNPFDFLIYPETCLSLPMVYPPPLSEDLQSFMTTGKVAPQVRDFANSILSQAKGQTMDFLVLLSQCMKRDFVYEFRHAGAPYQPDDTLASKRGSCRDWAILYMAAARAVGLASRFVSGYYFDENPKSPDLHAWVEVYIPGGGWRGFDPSLGLACYGHHIALATSASAAGAAPIQGSYKGYAHSEMKLELEYQYSPVVAAP